MPQNRESRAHGVKHSASRPNRGALRDKCDPVPRSRGRGFWPTGPYPQTRKAFQTQTSCGRDVSKNRNRIYRLPESIEPKEWAASISELLRLDWPSLRIRYGPHSVKVTPGRGNENPPRSCENWQQMNRPNQRAIRLICRVTYVMSPSDPVRGCLYRRCIEKRYPSNRRMQSQRSCNAPQTQPRLETRAPNQPARHGYRTQDRRLKIRLYAWRA